MNATDENEQLGGAVLAVHAGQWTAFGDDLSFLGRKKVKTLTNRSTIGAEVFGEANVGRMVSRFTLEKALVEVGEFFVAAAEMLTEQVEAFATSRFDQASDQQPVNSPSRFLEANQEIQFAAVGSGLEPAKWNLAPFEKLDDHPVVFQFFFDDGGHFSSQLDVVGVGVHQVKRCGSGFPFAVGVIDEDFVERKLDLSEPTNGRRGLEVKHDQAKKRGNGTGLT